MAHEHIKDTDTVYIRNDANGGVGSCLGKAFKAKWSREGYSQISEDEYLAGVAVLQAEQDDFVASGTIASLPDGEPSAEDIATGKAEGRDPDMAQVAKTRAAARKAGVSVPDEPATGAGVHRGEG